MRSEHDQPRIIRPFAPLTGPEACPPNGWSTGNSIAGRLLFMCDVALGKAKAVTIEFFAVDPEGQALYALPTTMGDADDRTVITVTKSKRIAVPVEGAGSKMVHMKVTPLGGGDKGKDVTDCGIGIKVGHQGT